MHSIIWIIFIHLQVVHSLPNGAPAQACPSMVPDHGGSPQTCSTSYNIQADRSTFGLGENVLITLNGTTTSNTFRGVLLIAKVQSTGDIIGTWSTSDSAMQTVACGGVANTGITHTSNNDKMQTQATWTAPSTSVSGTVIIRATVVRTYASYYVNCFAVTLSTRQANQSATTSNSATVTPTTSSTSSSTTAVTTTTANVIGGNIGWTYANGTTTVQIQANNLQTSQWLAIALSLDQQMGQDHVFVCKRQADNTVAVQRMINPDGTMPSISVDGISNIGGNFTVISQRFDNGIVYCEFTLSGFSTSKSESRAASIFTLSQSADYYPLIAKGDLDSSNGMEQHSAREALSQTVRLNQQGTINLAGLSFDSSQINLMKAHGIIMLFTWILLVSTGALIAQFFKTSWPERKICGKAVWFSIHRAVMLCVTTLTIIGFILILVAEKGQWISSNEKAAFAHSICGIIVIIFAVIQPIMALFRCTPDAPNRFIFNYSHGFVGFTAFILSIVTLFLGMFTPELNFEKKEWAILVIWVIWVTTIFLSFIGVELYFRKYAVGPDDAETYDLQDPSASPGFKPEPRKNEKNLLKDRIKTILLGIHLLVAFILALALAIVIGRF